MSLLNFRIVFFLRYMLVNRLVPVASMHFQHLWMNEQIGFHLSIWDLHFWRGQNLRYFTGKIFISFFKCQNNVNHDETASPDLKMRKILPSDTVGPIYTTEDGEFLILGLFSVQQFT